MAASSFARLLATDLLGDTLPAEVHAAIAQRLDTLRREGGLGDLAGYAHRHLLDHLLRAADLPAEHARRAPVLRMLHDLANDDAWLLDAAEDVGPALVGSALAQAARTAVTEQRNERAEVLLHAACTARTVGATGLWTAVQVQAVLWGEPAMEAEASGRLRAAGARCARLVSGLGSRRRVGLAVFDLHESRVTATGWHPSGTVVASGDAGGRVWVWDARSGRPETGPLPHGDRVRAVAWSPDGVHLATACVDGTAHIWSPATGRPVTGPLVHRAQVNVVAWSPDGTCLATAADDGTARIWDVATGRPTTGELEHVRAMGPLVLGPDGIHHRESTGHERADVPRRTGGETGTAGLTVIIPVAAAVWSPRGTHLATAHDHLVSIWDAATGDRVSEPLAHDAYVRSVSWAADGAHLSTVSGVGRTVRVWDAGTWRETSSPVDRDRQAPDRSGSLNDATTWSPEGSRAAIAEERFVRIVSRATIDDPPEPLLGTASIDALRWSSDGTLLATDTDRDTTSTWDPATGQATTAISSSPDSAHPDTAPVHHDDPDAVLAWSPDGTRLAASTTPQLAKGLWKETEDLVPARTSTRIWDLATGQATTEPIHHDAPVTALAWSPDGTHLATATDEGMTHIWDPTTGRPTSEPIHHDTAVTALAWSPDGTHLATATEADRGRREAMLWLWEVAPGAHRPEGRG